jgi:L-alanine-DL-glutamate epimerase-like enolase superfamily enzyme
VTVAPLNVPMKSAFGIAGGAQESVRNVLVTLRLSNGVVGYGEGAPLESYNGETQAQVLAAAKNGGLEGKDISSWRTLLSQLEAQLTSGAAKAALGMAVLDAWCKVHGLPLYRLFGGSETKVQTDVTITLSDDAEDAARRIKKMGVKIAKVKVGKDVSFDAARASCAHNAGLKVLLDANQGYNANQALRLLSKLPFKPILFEQPVPKDDWKGLAAVNKKCPVAADESVASRKDALRMAKERAASVINIKLMKAGLLEAWDIALIARSAGLGLMIGGNVESRLAMAAAAHFACGLGGFSFIDLDTPLWLAREPMRGLSMSPKGVYDLSAAPSGVGVIPE